MGTLLFPTMVFHKPCEILAQSTLMALAIKNACTMTSLLDSATAALASSASGAAKGTAEQMGSGVCSGIAGHAHATLSRLSVKHSARPLVQGSVVPLHPLGGEALSALSSYRPIKKGCTLVLSKKG